MISPRTARSRWRSSAARRRRGDARRRHRRRAPVLTLADMAAPPVAHGDRSDEELAAIAAELDAIARRRPRRPRRARRRLHPPRHPRPAPARARAAARCWSLARQPRRRSLAGTGVARRSPRSSRTWRSATTCMHGQYDWMSDPAHPLARPGSGTPPRPPRRGSTRTTTSTTRTRTSLGKDRDLGYSAMRVDPEQPWHPVYLLQPDLRAADGAVFEWGIALYDMELDAVAQGHARPRSRPARRSAAFARKAARQLAKDYVLFPLLAGPLVASARWPATVDRQRRRATSGCTRSSSWATSPRAPSTFTEELPRGRDAAAAGTSAS